MIIGGLVAIVVALPLFLWAILSDGNFDIRNRAQEPVTVNFSEDAPDVELSTPLVAAEDTQTIEVRYRFEGVESSAAEGEKIMVWFSSTEGITSGKSRVTATHTGSGVYGSVIQFTDPPPAGTYTVYIDSEKHLEGSASFTMPETEVGVARTVVDLTAAPLTIGGVEASEVTSRLNKLCQNMTEDDLRVADVDYNGCVDTKDLFLISR